MFHRPRLLPRPVASAALLGAAALAGCGSSTPAATHPSSTSAPASSSAGATAPSPGAGAPPANALSADARSAGTGDVPDNQVFLTFTSPRTGWSMKYPEGWTRNGSGPTTIFSDKNNLVRVAVRAGAAPTPASVATELRTLRTREPTLSFAPPVTVALPADPAAVRARYTTQSAPNPVTGKRVVLIVDRYVLHAGSRVATVDLGTPRGVDNVDAYRMMIRSFRWR